MHGQTNRNSIGAGELQSRLRRRLLRVTLPAVAQLARAADGEPVFENDRAIRACIALVRLVPVLLGQQHGSDRCEEAPSPIHPDHRHEAQAIMQRMNELREEALAAKAAGKLCHYQG